MVRVPDATLGRREPLPRPPPIIEGASTPMRYCAIVPDRHASCALPLPSPDAWTLPFRGSPWRDWFTTTEHLSPVLQEQLGGRFVTLRYLDSPVDPATAAIASTRRGRSRRCAPWGRHLGRLASLEDDRHAPDARRARPGAHRPSAGSRTDPSLRPGRAIRQRRLCRAPGKRRRAQRHGGGRQSLRERQGGELLQDAEAGDGLVTTDKFCFVRPTTLRLRRWSGSRQQRHSLPQGDDLPVEGGDDGADMAGPARASAAGRCATPLGSGVSAPPPLARGTTAGGERCE